MLASAVKFTPACLWLFALLDYGCAQDIANNSQVNGARVPATGLPFLTKTGYVRRRRASTSEATLFCLTPPQPANGEYKRHRDDCNQIIGCEVPVGSPLQPGSTLVYRCNPGYRVNGKSEVNCRLQGKWSPIPECVEVKCDSLNTASTMVSCTHFGKEINCHSPVPPGTRAEVTCRSGYKKDTEFVTTRKGVVNCNVNGTWEPQPIRCVPVCGRTITNQQPFVSGGRPAKIGEFPWHASLFEKMDLPSGNELVFICGATVIHTNLLLTAAHCVYSDITGTKTDPGKLFVITGNIFRDYDSPVHNSNLVRKSVVKSVYTFCHYYGLTGNYASDIALLELQQPFEFSHILLPACLDDSEYRDQFLEPGAYGRVAGFGRTETGATSGILQTITVPYISYSQCRAFNSTAENVAFISTDKFCAGYSNGSAVCEGDSGGGLVFRKGDLWYVMGIVSVGLGRDTSSGERTCDRYSYTLYTKVSIYMDWIQDVLSSVERKQRYPSCDHDSQTSAATSATPTTTSRPGVTPEVKPNAVPSSTASSLPYFCSAPPQPANGERKLHRNYCKDDSDMDCDIAPGTKVKSATQLVYYCGSRFAIEGNSDVYCLASGEWTPLPICVGDSCDLRNGSLGECTLLKDCQPVLEELKSGRTPDQQCGFSDNEPVVCCPTSPSLETMTSLPPETEDRVGDGRGAIARQKCTEYAKYVDTSTCLTIIFHKYRGYSEKGTADTVGYPHMAAVGLVLDDGMISWYCGGTLISESFVMTTVTCAGSTEQANSTWVRVGAKNLARSDDGVGPEDRRVAERFLHPDYKFPAAYNDIALLRLESPVPFNERIKPACLHTAPTTGTQEAIATEWGSLDSSDGVRSDKLLEVLLPLVDLETCSAKWIYRKEDKQMPNGIDGDRMICAGGVDKDTCPGNYGGPLMTVSRKERCMYDVVGITSLGEFCPAGSPGIFTRVYHYVTWIESIVWKQG